MWLSYFLAISLVLTIGQCQEDQYLPTLMWDNNNPIFQCEDPIIRMRSSDILQTHCQDRAIHNYIRNYRFASRLDKTRMVYVQNADQYNRCDATNGLPLLRCEDGQTAQECTVNNGIQATDCTVYFNLLTIEQQKDIFVLTPGKIHHFIGTTLDDSLTPCHGNGSFSNPMKFRLYVCTEEEEKAGLCEPCKSEACYYSHCKQKCGDWKDTSQNIFQDATGLCFKHQVQTCLGEFTAISKNSTREVQIPCPEKQCERWRDSGLLAYAEEACTKPQDRECTDLRGVKTIEKRDLPIECPPMECTAYETIEAITRPIKDGVSCYEMRKRFCTFTLPGNEEKQVVSETNEVNVTCATIKEPNTEPVVGNKNDDDKDLYIYIAIAASIGSLCIGIIIGCVLMKLCTGKTQKVEIVKTVEKVVPVDGLGPIMSYDNKNFHLDPVMEDAHHQPFNLNDVEFIPATQKIGTTKRQVMVARSVSFYNPDVQTGHYYRRNTADNTTNKYRPPSTITESSRNVMRHPSATSKTVLIRHHSDVTERPRSDSDTSVFNLKQPEDCVSEEV